MRQKLILPAIFAILIVASCTKQEASITSKKDEIDLQITNQRGPSDISPNAAPPKYRIVFGTKQQIGENQFLCHQSEDVCFIIGPIYYRQSNPADNEIDAELSIKDKRLVLYVDFEDTNSHKFLKSGAIKIKTSKQVSQTFAEYFGVDPDYEIKAGEYLPLPTKNNKLMYQF